MLVGSKEAQVVRTAKETKEMQNLRSERTMPLIRTQLDFASVVVSHPYSHRDSINSIITPPAGKGKEEGRR
jgi:hypothetical protein